MLVPFLILGMVLAPVSGKRCEAIVAPMCKDLQYNATVMPNILGHGNQSVAVVKLGDYEPFLNHSCSPYLRFFVCSVFVPLCSKEANVAIPPCRSLCEDVKTSCESVLWLNWPEDFGCSKFPEPSKSLCIKPPEDDPELHRGSELIPWDHIHGVMPGTRHCPSGTALKEDKCLKVCDRSEYEELAVSRYRVLYEVWTAVWSILCLIVTSFALLTFLIQPKRFRWPARPVLYLTICGFTTSIVYLIKWVGGPLTCSGGTVLIKPSDSLGCVGAALLLLFCEVAFSLWWYVFSLVWFLSAAKEWSTEAIEGISTRLHVMLWSTTTAATVYALLSNSIVANEFTGLCKVKSDALVIVKLLFVVLGSVLAVLTSVALKNVRKAMVYLYAGRNPYKLERLICRVGVTSLGICVPLFLCLLCSFFDSLTSVMVEVGMKLLSAIFAAMWVFSSKTFKSWNKVLRPNFTSKLRDIPVTKV